jgi:peptide/nickel transport system substrate-binding protein
MWLSAKKKYLLQGIMCCCLWLCGCSSTAPTDERQVFRINLSSGNLDSIDPAFAKDLYVMWICHMVYNTLVETDSNLHVVPSLAKSWQVSDDGLVYTFHIRTGVYFQDNPLFPNGKGRMMTAADVAYSYSRLIDPTVASSGAWIFNDKVAKEQPFTAIDDTTFQIRLRQPFRPLPYILSMPYCSIVPHEVTKALGKDYRSHPCGTGPYQLHYWDEGNVLILKRHNRYWERDAAGKQLPYTDAVQVSFTDSKATEFFLFLQGKLDFVNGVDGSFKDLVLNKKGVLKPEYAHKLRLQKQTYLNTEYIGLQQDASLPVMRSSALSNPLVRQAMNYAIDRQKIVTYFRNGVGVPATGGFIPPGMPGHNSHSGYSYNPAKALQLLQQAGYPQGKGLPPITISTPDNYLDIVNFVVGELQEVGIPARAATMQPNILRQQMSQGKIEAFRAQWIADYPDGETYMAFFNGRLPAPPNYTRYKNHIVDSLYDLSMQQPDSVRPMWYARMDSIVMSSAPVLPLFYDQLLHFTQNRVEGFSCNAMNLIDIKHVRKR